MPKFWATALAFTAVLFAMTQVAAGFPSGSLQEPALPAGAASWTPQGLEWAQNARRLHQLPAPGGATGRACDATGELTCAGASGTNPMCCNKANFRCATRPDTGGPRCAMCPSQCLAQCLPGYKCGPDANGCWGCVAAPAPECDVATPCKDGKICISGTCKPHPCNSAKCGGSTPRCVLNDNQEAACVAAAATQGCSPKCGTGFVCQQQPVSTAAAKAGTTGTASWQCVKVTAQVRRPQRQAAAVQKRGRRLL